MSNLEEDIAKAAALGMSYGRYKMEHPQEPAVKPVEVVDDEPPNAECGICGKPFRRRSGRQKYCCWECSYEALKRRSDAQYQKKSPRKGKVTCPVCGILFRPRHGSQKYCSVVCRGENEKETKRTRRYREEKS